MTQLRFVPATFAASAIFLFSSLSSAIVAPNPGCGEGPSCAVGFECTVVGVSGCSAGPCAPGQPCPENECATTVEMGCTPAHCSVDAECAPGMVCHEWQQGCAATDCFCGDGPDCGCGVCEPTAVSMCTPRYALPCKLAADCGDGFTCEEEMTSCGGSSPGSGPTPNGTAGAGSAPAPLPTPIPECSPAPTGRFQCVPKEIDCTTVAECPAGWSCDATTATDPGPAPCPPGDPCAARPSAPEPTTSACRPPYYGGNSANDPDQPPTPTTNQGTAGTRSSSGSGTGTPSSAGKSGESAPLGAPSGAGGGSATGASNAADASSNESSACQMGHAPASRGVFALLTLLGALLGLQRRRPRA